MSESASTGLGTYFRWVRATWAGWVIGVPLVVAFALLGEAMGVGGAQVFVGVGMGTGIGFMQRRVVRELFEGRSSWAWLWSSAVGLGLPFLASDVTKALGWTHSYSLFYSITPAGLIVGAWQTALLRPRVRHASWWLAASLLGWTLASGMATAADAMSRSRQLTGIWGALAYLGVVAGGGLVLGLVTGLAWVRMRKEDHGV